MPQAPDEADSPFGSEGFRSDAQHMVFIFCVKAPFRYFRMLIKYLVDFAIGTKRADVSLENKELGGDCVHSIFGIMASAP